MFSLCHQGSAIRSSETTRVWMNSVLGSDINEIVRMSLVLRTINKPTVDISDV